jgi:hypothetical protein
VQRLLLILPSATYRAPDFMAAARELGVAVTVASDRAAAMSAAMGERALTLRSSEVTKELPMEYAVELNRLIQLEMVGSIG